MALVLRVRNRWTNYGFNCKEIQLSDIPIGPRPLYFIIGTVVVITERVSDAWISHPE